MRSGLDWHRHQRIEPDAEPCTVRRVAFAVLWPV